MPTLLVQQESRHLSIPTIEIKSFVNGCGESWCHCDAPLIIQSFYYHLYNNQLSSTRPAELTPHLPPNLEISLFLCLPQVLCQKVYELAAKKVLITPLDLIWVCFCCCALCQALSALLPLPLQFFFGVHLVVTGAHRRVCCLALQLQSMMKHN